MTQPATTSRSGTPWVLFAVLGVVAASLAVVGVAGGFERRAAPTVAVAPGTELDAGNLVFRLDSATVVFRTKATGDPWQVVVSGSVRNPHDESLAPLSGDYGNLVGIDRVSDQFVVRPQYGLGAVDPDRPWGNRRQVVPPVDRWMEFRAAFTFSGSYAPGDGFEVGVVAMEYTANTILGLSDDPAWNPDSFASPWTVTVPLTRLPDTDY